MAEVELHGAYIWDCDHCGRENLERAMACEDDDGVRFEADEDVIVESLYAPVTVTCSHCGQAYDAVLAGQSEEGGEP